MTTVMIKIIKVQLYVDKEGLYRWRARARNGKIIADSGQGYKRKRDAIAGYKLNYRSWPQLEDQT